MNVRQSDCECRYRIKINQQSTGDFCSLWFNLIQCRCYANSFYVYTLLQCTLIYLLLSDIRIHKSEFRAKRCTSNMKKQNKTKHLNSFEPLRQYFFWILIQRWRIMSTCQIKVISDVNREQLNIIDSKKPL